MILSFTQKTEAILAVGVQGVLKAKMHSQCHYLNTIPAYYSPVDGERYADITELSSCYVSPLSYLSSNEDVYNQREARSSHTCFTQCFRVAASQV